MSKLGSILSKLVGVLILITPPAFATEVEITPFIGKMNGSDLTIPDSSTSISVDSATHFGIGIAWQESPNGQGQILINYASHEFQTGDENPTRSVDIIYAHFNGIALFEQRNYLTTVSVGLGAARFSSDGGSEISPSFTAAIGTQYKISNESSIVTELRGYASLMKDGDTLFCQNEVCAAEYDDSPWISTSIAIGYSYKF